MTRNRLADRCRARAASGALLALLLCMLASPALAQITFVGVEMTDDISDQVSSLSIDRPSDVVEGNVMIAQVAVRAGSSMSITAPSGWALLQRQHYDASFGQAIYYRIAGASEPASYRWDFDSSVRTAGGILAYGGVDTDDPIADSDSAADWLWPTTIAYAPPVTTTIDESAIVALYASADGRNEFTPGVGSERVDGRTMAGPNGLTIGALDGLLVTAGSSGYLPASFDDRTAPFVGQTVALNPASTIVLDHIRIEHPGSALTCEPASITLRACIDADCTAEYPDPVTVTLSPASGWNSNPVTFTGSTTLTLSSSSVQTLTLDAAPTPAAVSATRCFTGASETCDLSFADTGFVFSTIPTQIAGTSSSGITMRAVHTSDDGTACTAALAGTHDIELASECVNPTTCAGRQISIGATPIANNAAGPSSGFGYSAVSLAFDGNAETSFTLSYPDVGSMRLFARYTVDTDATLLGNSNTFVVKPAGFTVTGIKRSVDNVPNPAADDAGDDRLIAAGEAFSATITAVTSSGVATPNFGRESPAQGVELVHTLHAPVPGNAGTLANGSIAGGEFSSGIAMVDDLSWSEVGIIRLTANVAGDDYLLAGPVAGTASETIGRFVPHHFDVAVFAGCTGGSSDFTWSGQPFRATVVARPACSPCAGEVTANYAGDFAHDITLSDDTGDSSRFDGNVIPASVFAAGSGSSALTSDPAPLRYTFVSTATAPLDLFLRAVDPDGVSSATVPGIEGSTQIRSGRLRLLNVVGRGNESVQMPLRIESWQELAASPGTYDWDIEDEDGCTVLAVGNFSSNPAGQLSSPVTLVNGNGAVTVDPIVHGNVDVTANLGTLAPWLQFDWFGSGRVDPTARVGFGLNPGNDKQIFRREVIRGN